MYFFGNNCITAAVKSGIAREAAVLYRLEETHKALYEEARRAMDAIPLCKPYTLETPIKAKKQYLSPSPTIKEYLEKKSIPDYWEPKLLTKEGTIQDALHLLEF